MFNKTLAEIHAMPKVRPRCACCKKKRGRFGAKRQWWNISGRDFCSQACAITGER